MSYAERERERASGRDGIEKYICVYRAQMCIYFTSAATATTIFVEWKISSVFQ